MRSDGLKITALFALMFVNLACGAKVKSKSSGDESAAQAVDASLSVTTYDEAGLALLATTASFSGAVAGCITAQSPTFDQSSASVSLLVGDTGCYARLNTIAVTFGDGTSATYAPDASYKFAAGTSVIVASASSSKVMKIGVASNIPSPIIASPAPQVTMTISFVDFGGSQTASVKTATAGIDVSVENSVPYQLASVDLTVDGATGGGAFESKLNCYSSVGADNNCDGMAQTTLKAGMAIDTYKTGATPRDLTLAECSALSTGGGSKTPAATPVLTDGNAAMPNGGASFQLSGPAPLCDAANKDLVLALSHPSASSCKWWRISVSCP